MRKGCFYGLRFLSSRYAECLGWVASRRWAATGEFHRLNGGRRPQPAVRHTWKPASKRPDLMQLQTFPIERYTGDISYSID